MKRRKFRLRLSAELQYCRERLDKCAVSASNGRPLPTLESFYRGKIDAYKSALEWAKPKRERAWLTANTTY